MKDLGVEPTIENLMKITNQEASVLYKKRFWAPIKGDEIKSLSFSYALYDFHVNAPGHAVKLIQKAVNTLGGNLVIDKKMGPKSVKAINRMDAHQLFDEFQKNRVDYYRDRANKIPSQRVFLNSWLKRTNSIKFER